MPSSDLRKAAKSKECLVRLPGCDYDPETTVLAHIRYAGMAGTGQKPPDICGIRACFSCHNVIDGRDGDLERSPNSWEAVVLSALLRTLRAYEREELI